MPEGSNRYRIGELSRLSIDLAEMDAGARISVSLARTTAVVEGMGWLRRCCAFCRKSVLGLDERAADSPVRRGIDAWPALLFTVQINTVE
jgi:hypothetical protein